MYNSNNKYKMEGSVWFKRFIKDCSKISTHIKFKRIKYGFFRLYWTGGGEPAYLHEVYSSMPYKGYDIEMKNFKLESQKFYEEFEDQPDLIRKIKNYVEGYVDSLDRIKTRVYILKNNKEARETLTKAYKKTKVK